MCAAHAHDVAVGERLLALDPKAIHLCAVGAAEVGHHVATGGGAHFGVTTTHVAVGERNGALVEAADADRLTGVAMGRGSGDSSSPFARSWARVRTVKYRFE